MADPRPTREQMEQFIKRHGWREDRMTVSPFRWRDPKARGALWRLVDAWELEKGRQHK